MENTTQPTKTKASKFNCKSPSLFTIPLDVYSDEVEKHRDKNAFIKIQELEKDVALLREKFLCYCEQHLNRLKLTQFLVSRSLAVNRKVVGRRFEVN